MENKPQVAPQSSTAQEPSSESFRQNFYTVKNDEELKQDYESFFDAPPEEVKKGDQLNKFFDVEKPPDQENLG